MDESITGGLILLGVVGAVFLAMLLVAFGRPGDEGPGDLDPFDGEL